MCMHEMNITMHIDHSTSHFVACVALHCAVCVHTHIASHSLSMHACYASRARLGSSLLVAIDSACTHARAQHDACACACVCVCACVDATCAAVRAHACDAMLAATRCMLARDVHVLK